MDNSPFVRNLAKALVSRRKRMRLTVKDLALKACVNSNLICCMEDQTDPDIDFLSFLRIVDALETSAAEICFLAERGGNLLRIVENVPFVTADDFGGTVKT